MIDVFFISGLKEEYDCYSLSPFGSVFLDRTEAIKYANVELDEVLEEFSIDKDQEIQIVDEEECYSIFIYKEGEVRFEASVIKKTLIHAQT